MTDDPNTPQLPVSLLPYEDWLEDAHREVMLKALEFAQREGLPGDHHFYLTFRTDLPGVEIPTRLRERYPREMTIVLQHQFRDLTVDRTLRFVSVGLSFGGVPSTLIIPVDAITAFADPHIQLMLQFRQPEARAQKDATEAAPPHQEAEVRDFRTDAPASSKERATSEDDTVERKEAEVVSLAAFRRKPQSDSPGDKE